MCGIVGYVGKETRDLSQHLVRLLGTLEYRGYDSAGVTTLEQKILNTIKAVGGLSKLRERLPATSLPAALGFAHTRWATHGKPSERNALPIQTANGKAAIIFNGIIENHLTLRQRLSRVATTFQTDNDAETLLLWIMHHYEGDLLEAVQRGLVEIEGRYAFCIIHTDQPQTMICVSHGNPLVIGMGTKGSYVASDVQAIHAEVERIHYLEHQTIARLTPTGFYLWNFQGISKEPALTPVPVGAAVALDSRFETFTLQEIHAQPECVILAVNIAKGITKDLQTLGQHIQRVVLVGCGSAYYAGLAGAALIQKHARIPASAVIASEFKVGSPIIDPRTLVIAISQSGETADTLSCLEFAKQCDAPTLALCNIVTSSMARQADFIVPLGCGPEIGVASTKAYTAMLTHLTFLALAFGLAKRHLTQDVWLTHCDAAQLLPDSIERILNKRDAFAKMAKTLRERRNFLYVGRDLCMATAYEGALKLRELSYRHAEGIGAGELKHGTLALIEPQYPVIAIAPRSESSAKMINSVQEINARGGQVWSICTEGDAAMLDMSYQAITIPETLPAFLPVLAAIPLQLFAYEFAKTLGRNIDRPRNLAKSVTVE